MLASLFIKIPLSKINFIITFNKEDTVSAFSL